MEFLELESSSLIESFGLLVFTVAVALSLLIPFNPFKKKGPKTVLESKKN